MAIKKKNKKKSKNTANNETLPSKKINLPAFGMAEDILGMQSAESGPRSAELQEVARYAEPEIKAGQAAGELHLVTFHLETEEFGVDIGRVQEIIRVGQITVVPNAPEFIRGVINLRGKIIPVLDLRKRLALPETPFDKNSRIIVVEAGPKVLGLLVDRVSQVIRMPAASVDAPPDEIEESRAFVRGIGKIDSRLIMIMELDRVLTKDVRQVEV